jgi:hypothetical protein
MREACSRVVGAMGSVWPYLGWVLFLAVVLGPFCVGKEMGPAVIVVGIAVLLAPI